MQTFLQTVWQVGNEDVLVHIFKHSHGAKGIVFPFFLWENLIVSLKWKGLDGAEDGCLGLECVCIWRMLYLFTPSALVHVFRSTTVEYNGLQIHK